VSQSLLVFTLGLTLGACSQPRSTSNSSAAASDSQRAEKMQPANEMSFNGWGPFTFGMNLEDALTAHPGVVWNEKPSRKCRVETPLRGCTLNSAQDSRIPLTAGVALLPTVIFNQEGKLAAIRLGKFLRGNITPAHCKRAYGQLLNRLQETWGLPEANSSTKRGTLSRTLSNKGELSPVMEDEAVFGRETFHVQPDGRRIILLSRYIGKTDVARAICYLSIEYRGPDSLQSPPEERRHPLKNWD